jgi:hypothetical protein
LILKLEQVGYVFLETLGPNVIADFGVDELNVDPHAIATALHRTLKDIAHV